MVYNHINNYIYSQFTGQLNNGYRSLQYVQNDAQFKGIEEMIITIDKQLFLVIMLEQIYYTIKEIYTRIPAYHLSTYIKHSLQKT